MSNGEAAQAASTLTPRLALPAPRFYAAAFAALERTEARSRMRQRRSGTFVSGASGTVRLPAPLLPTLPEAERRRRIARASSAVAADIAPRYSVVDCGERGASVYAPLPAPRQPLYTPLQAALLDGIRRMRRWRYYSETALPAPEAGLPLDGCLCRVCLTGGAASAAPAKHQVSASAARGKRQSAASAA